MIHLAAFLGNPGAEYQRNRHNAGRLLAEKFFPLICGGGQPAFRTRFRSLFYSAQCETADGGENIVFLEPETYMNLSGEAVVEAALYYKIAPSQILVVQDELELPLGTLSLKWSGGLGGHNGLRSLKSCLGTADFWRLRVGIGRPPNNDVYNWVLSNFTEDEAPILEAVLQSGAELLAAIVRDGPEAYQKEWGKKMVCEVEHG